MAIDTDKLNAFVGQFVVDLGATVHAPPFDVVEGGRLAVLQDPQGAFVMLWQPNQNRGVELVNTPGAFCWNKLHTPDVEASTHFYGQLFGWALQPFEQSAVPYFIIQNSGRANGGITEAQEGMPTAWLVYFAVEDINDGLAKVGELGGDTIVGPIDIGVAKIGIVSDPQGGVFALYFAHFHLSVAAAVGFIALFGIAVMDGIIILSQYNQLIDEGFDRVRAVIRTGELQLRPVLMTCVVAGVGLLPAALSAGIGSQVQKPLAVVVVTGMMLAPLVILVTLPVLISFFSSRAR